MILNGKEFAQEIKNALRKECSGFSRKPCLDIVYAGSDPAIENFMGIKTRAGEEISAKTVIHRFPSDIAEADLLKKVKEIAAAEETDGIIIQLPLPNGISAEKILNAVPPEKDPDMLSEASWKLFTDGKTENIPPVAEAMMEILRAHDISLKGKNVVIMGRGMLVGKPIRVCAEREGANVTVLNSTTGDPTPHLQKADVVFSGMGKPHLIKPEMLKEGVVLVDGGTGSLDGKIAGDADPACAEKCALFTPVPGGVGPVMVAMLFQNLIANIKKSDKH